MLHCIILLLLYYIMLYFIIILLCYIMYEENYYLSTVFADGANWILMDSHEILTRGRHQVYLH